MLAFIRTVITVMGKAFSCCCRENEKEEAIGETTRLLTERKTTVTDLHNNRQTNYLCAKESLTFEMDVSNDEIMNNNSYNKISENRLEYEFGKKVIDITAMDKPVIKVGSDEWQKRVKLYERRVAQIEKPLVLRSKILSNQMQGTDSVRHFEPISAEDIELITELSERATEAVLKGFQIECKESIVVPFNPWNRS